MGNNMYIADCRAYGQVNLSVSKSMGNLTTSNDPSAILPLDKQIELTHGRGSGQSNMLFYKSSTIAKSSYEDFDLIGTLTSHFGDNVSFDEVKILVVKNLSATCTIRVVGQTFYNWTSGAGDYVVIPPNGFVMLATTGTGYLVAGGADVLRLQNTNGSSAASYEISIVGVEADSSSSSSSASSESSSSQSSGSSSSQSTASSASSESTASSASTESSSQSSISSSGSSASSASSSSSSPATSSSSSPATSSSSQSTASSASTESSESSSQSTASSESSSSSSPATSSSSSSTASSASSASSSSSSPATSSSSSVTPRFHDPDIDAYDGNLIAVWKMEETSGTRYDSAGAYDLTDGNTVGYTTGKSGNAANFVRANNEYLNVINGLCRNKTKLSLSFWFRATSIGGAGGADNIILVGETTATSGVTRYAVTATYESKLRIGMRDVDDGAVTAEVYSTSTFSADTTYHVVAIIDTASDTIKAWVNGTNWIDSSNAMNSFPDTNSAEGWTVGNFYPGQTYGISGWIDEVYVWDDAISAAAIAALYNSGTGKFYDA